MFEELKKNIEQEKNIIHQIRHISASLNDLSADEKTFYSNSIRSLKNQLKILNNSIPLLINEASPLKQLNDYKVPAVPQPKKNENLARLSYISPVTQEKNFVTINKEDKENFIKELSFSGNLLKRLNETKNEKVSEKGETSEKTTKLIRISNIFFSRISEKIAPRFSDVKEDLKQGNINLLITTYISIALFVSLLLLVAGLVFIGILSFFNFKNIIWIWLPFVFAGFSLVGFYLFPSSQKTAVRTNISDEIPFAAIYMA